LKHWREFYQAPVSGVSSRVSVPQNETPSTPHTLHLTPDSELTQLLNTYITIPSANGFLLIHQQAAHERVLYDQLKNASKDKAVATQRSMFPSTLELTPADAAVMEEIISDLQHLGYMIEPFGKNTYVIQGTPADVEAGNDKHIIDILLEQYKHFSNEVKFSKREKLIRSLARQQAIKTGIRLTEREMRQLVIDLFSCEQPNITMDGNPTYLEFKQEQLERMFRG
jgi:DNA mismatch repair protein MutL